MSAEYTLQEAADLLGVHYMTAYRYVRLGQLEAHKHGGTWHIADVAIAAFRDGVSTGPVERGVSAPWMQRLEGRLVDGDAQGSWTLVESAMASGLSARDVYLEMLGPAMVSIGQRWSAGELDVASEHQASVIAGRIMGRLSPHFARRGRSLGDLVIGAPAGEMHGLPGNMVADLMRRHGWNVRDLGADSPAASFVHAAGLASQLRGIGISVSRPEQFDVVSETCAVLRAELDGVMIVLGGRAVEDDARARDLGADVVAASADVFHEYLMSTSSQR